MPAPHTGPPGRTHGVDRLDAYGFLALQAAAYVEGEGEDEGLGPALTAVHHPWYHIT
jgi:hypothetical protein